MKSEDSGRNVVVGRKMLLAETGKSPRTTPKTFVHVHTIGQVMLQRIQMLLHLEFLGKAAENSNHVLVVLGQASVPLSQ